MSRNVTPLLLALVVPACQTDTSASEDGLGLRPRIPEDLSQALSDDVSYLLSDTEALAGDLPADAAYRSAQQSGGDCFGGVGSCTWCAEWSGSPDSGSFTLGAEDLPCGREVTAPAVSVDYTVEAGDLSGTWTLDGDGIVVSALGTREASLVTERPGIGGGSYDVSWVLDDLTVTVGLDGEVDSFTATIVYTSFAGHAWTVEMSGTPQSVEGTATRDDGASCSVSGTPESITLGCTGA